MTRRRYVTTGDDLKISDVVINASGLAKTSAVSEAIQEAVSGIVVEAPEGRSVELQATATHVQWRYDGDVAWIDLISFVPTDDLSPSDLPLRVPVVTDAGGVVLVPDPWSARVAAAEAAAVAVAATITTEDAAVALLLENPASDTVTALRSVPEVSPGAGDLMVPLDLWDAYTMPATYVDYLAGIRSSLSAQLTDGSVVETDRGVGSSADHIYSFRAGDGPHRVLLVSGTHPQESHTFAMGQRWFEQFVKSDHPVMVRLRNLVTVEWVACLVPNNYLGAALLNANGVNINRNFGFYHGAETSADKGSAPFSEPETVIIRTIVDEGAILALDLHSRGPIGSNEVAWTAPSPWMLGDRALVWSTLRQWAAAYPDLYGTTIDLMSTGGGPLLANWAAWYNRFTTRQGAHAMTLESNTDLHGSTYTTMTRNALRLMNGLITIAIGAWLQRGQVNPAPYPQLITAAGPGGSSSVSITLGGSLVDTSTYTPVTFTATSPATNTVTTSKIRFVVPFPCDVKITAFGTMAHVSGTIWRGTIGIGVDDAVNPNPSAITATAVGEATLRSSFTLNHSWSFLEPDGETIHEARLFYQRNEGGTARIVVTKMLIEYIPRWKEQPLPALAQVAG